MTYQVTLTENDRALLLYLLENEEVRLSGEISEHLCYSSQRSRLTRELLENNTTELSRVRNIITRVQWGV